MNDAGRDKSKSLMTPDANSFYWNPSNPICCHPSLCELYRRGIVLKDLDVGVKDG